MLVHIGGGRGKGTVVWVSCEMLDKGCIEPIREA
jgi:hypothetical protein